jgi:MFS family permease
VAARRIASLWLDTSPLRDSADYRRLWGSDIAGSLGDQIPVVAVPFQVYALTRSSLAVGLVGLAQLGPLLLGTVVAGGIADAFDRRRLLIVAQLGGAVCSGLLALLALGHPPLAAVYALAAGLAAFGSLESPLRNAAVPALVGPARLPAAVALSQTVSQGSQLTGPAVGGAIIAGASLSVAYAVSAACFLLAVVAVSRVRPLPPRGGRVRPGFAALREGFAFARSRPVLLSTFAIDLNAMIFGMPRAVFPALAAGTFGVGAGGLGLMYAAPGAGALAGALSSGWVGQVRRQGLAVQAAVLAWGIAITAFGIVPGGAFPLALLLLALAGAADVVSAVFRGTILQVETPDALRGRLSAMHIAVVTSGPRIGDVEAGTVARLTSPQISVVAGGLACIAGVFVLHALVPTLARYRRPAPAPPPTEPARRIG